MDSCVFLARFHDKRPMMRTTVEVSHGFDKFFCVLIHGQTDELLSFAGLLKRSKKIVNDVTDHPRVCP